MKSKKQFRELTDDELEQCVGGFNPFEHCENAPTPSGDGPMPKTRCHGLQ